MDQNILKLTRSAPVVRPDDSLRRASGLIATIEGSRLIVLSQGRIHGTVSERAIAAALSTANNAEAALDTPVSTVMDANLTCANAGITLKEAAALFAASDVDMLPVIDNLGAYRGVLYRSALVTYLTKTMKLPQTGGMATPLGVYLTTGSITGGAGSFGLFLTGLSLGAMMVAAQVIGALLMSGFDKISGIPLNVMLASPPISQFHIYDLPRYIMVALDMIAFAVMMRLSPLAGYHAAEHMTVHAMEAGEPLTPETVGRMPRVHPRCGTNILAGISLFTLLAAQAKSEIAILVAVVVFLFGRQALGAKMQYYVTTKNPTKKQLESGIAAGREIADKFHEKPNYQLKGFQKVWKMGFLQALAGMMLAMSIVDLLQKYIRIPGLM